MHFGQLTLDLATLSTCSLHMHLFELTHGDRKSHRYAHLSNDSAMIFHVFSTFKFCQTFELRHEIVPFWELNLWQQTVLAVAGAVLGVCTTKFGGIIVRFDDNQMCNEICTILSNSPCPNF